MSRCKGCGAEIEWIKTAAGKNMPIDPEPVFVLAAEGGTEVFLTDEGEVFRGKAVPTGEGAEVGFVPHWATCKAPEQFRRRG